MEAKPNINKPFDLVQCYSKHILMVVNIVLFIAFNTSLCKANRQYQLLSKFDQEFEIIEQHNRSLITESTPFIKINSASYDECTEVCFLDQRCDWMNVLILPNNRYDCYLFTRSALKDKEFSSNLNAIFISKKEMACSDYCETLSYMNVCGPCKCVSLCSLFNPFYCDCTVAKSELLTDCTNPIITEDGSVAALYNMIGFNGIIKAMCQENWDPSNDDLWLTILRRQYLRGDNTVYFLNGIGQAYEDKYFIGFHNFNSMTMRMQGQTLRIELMTLVDHHFWIELEDFKFISPQVVSYSRVVDFCCVNFDSSISFIDLIKIRIFQWRAFHENYWWYKRITFMIGPKSHSNRDEPGIFIRKKGILGHTSLPRFYCISFDYLLTEHIDIHGLFVIKDIVDITTTPVLFCYRFFHYMEKWKCSPSEQTLNAWTKISVTRYYYNGWFNAVYLNNRLFEKIALDKCIDYRRSPIYTSFRSGPLFVPCKMRNVYIDGKKVL